MSLSLPPTFSKLTMPLALRPTVGGSAPPTEQSPVQVRQRFQIGASVTAQWNRKQWYLVHVTAFEEGTYTVYFVECGSIKKLLSSQLRESDSSYPARGDMKDKEWYFEGDDELAAGMWKVRQLLPDKNAYRCTRLTGEGTNVDEFDIGHVIKQYVQRRDRDREMGFGTVLTTRTRRTCSPGDSR